jgi:hypothetical protein
MSTPAVVRVTAGVPNGGQFAPSAQGESTVVLEGAADTTVKLQPWGDELDAQIDVAMCDWATDLTEGMASGRADSNITDLLDVDEDQLLAAYGKERADYLGALRFDADIYEHDSYNSGHLTVSYQPDLAPHATVLAAVEFDGYNRPDIAGLTSHYPDSAQLPAWEDLESRLSDAVTEWATNLEEGDHEVEFSELIGDVDGDEDAMIEAYGEGRSDYLCSLSFHAQAEDRPDYGGRHEPSEYGMIGRLQVMSSDRQLFRSRFTHEDGPDISGLLNHCVTGPDGATTVQTQHRHAYGQLKEIRNPRTGELTDGPDGTAAIRSYDRDNNLRE